MVGEEEEVLLVGVLLGVGHGEGLGMGLLIVRGVVVIVIEVRKSSLGKSFCLLLAQ